MTIIVNGKPENVPDAITVRALIELRGLGSHAVAAEVNQCLVPRKAQNDYALKEGDRVELVSLVGGG